MTSRTILASNPEALVDEDVAEASDPRRGDLGLGDLDQAMVFAVSPMICKLRSMASSAMSTRSVSPLRALK